MLVYFYNKPIEAEEKFKRAIASINPKMGIGTLLSNPVSEMVQTKVL